MAFLDNDGLSYFWGKLKEKFAPKSHTHDDRYYTESEMNSKLGAKAESVVLAANSDLNAVKTPGIYSCGGGNSIKNKPSGLDAIGLIVVHNASGEYYTQILTSSSDANTYRRTCLNGTWSAWTQDKYTDTNTWRGIQNSLTSDSTSDSLSAAQGKALKTLVDGKLGKNEKASTAGTADVANSVDWSKVQNKPSTFTPASHTHPYLPVAGGTMTGALTFANNTWNPVGDDVQIGDHNTSGSFYIQGLNGATNIKLKKKGDTSTGSGDSATITYDGGNLIVDKTIQANLSGNASTATKATSADKATSATTADKATKLAASHTVSGGSDITLSFNYDGSGNSSANIGFYNCNHIVQNTNNYPFHRFAKLDANKGAYVDHSMTFLINQDYSGGGYGICRLVYRSDADSGNASVSAEWLVRRGFSADSVQVAIKTDKTNGAYCDAFYKSDSAYKGCSIRALASGGRASQSRTWTLIGSIEASGTTTSDKKNSSECWKSIAEAGTALHNQAYSSTASAVDSGYVNSAGTASSCTGNATTATGVKDYGDTNKTIKIGYAGAGLTT